MVNSEEASFCSRPGCRQRTLQSSCRCVAMLFAIHCGDCDDNVNTKIKKSAYKASALSFTLKSSFPQLMDSDGNGKIDLSEFEAAFTESLPQHMRASVDEPRLPLLPTMHHEPCVGDGGSGSSSRRGARHVVAEMAVQVPHAVLVSRIRLNS